MTRDEAIISLCAAILSNPNLNPRTATAGDVVTTARLIVDRVLPEPDHAPVIATPTGNPEPVHDGPWLAWAISVRGQGDWFRAYGHEHGYPAQFELWSRGMVRRALDAITAQNGAAV